MRRVLLTALLLGAGLGAIPAGALTDGLVIEPDLPVGEEAVSFVEYDVAASPADPGRLIVAGYAPSSGAVSVRVSEDGGSTWLPVHLPELARRGGADPQVVFLPSGEAVLTALSIKPGQVGRPRSDVAVFRSTDGGLHWEESARLADAGYDRPVLARHPSPGLEDADLHLLVRVPGDGSLMLWRSRDGGCSFSSPTVVARSSTEPLLSFGLEVTSSGRVVVPYVAITSEGPELRVATSSDGGGSFAPPVRVRPGPRSDRDAALARAARGILALSGGWASASDPSSETVYLGWRTDTDEGSRIEVSVSRDGGSTWGSPVRMAGGAGEQDQIVLAVAADGTLGVGWAASTASEAEQWRRDFWISASLDGGRHFLPPRRVNSRPSVPRVDGNRVPAVRSIRLEPDVLAIVGSSPLSRFPTGGDYFGMTVDAGGRFHPVWGDARTGEYRAWTAAVRVGGAPPEPVDLGPPTVLENVDVRVDSVDVRDGAAILWVRLHNRGDRPVWPPLRLVDAAGPPRSEARRRRASDRGGQGVELDYSDSLGDLDALPPGGVSTAMRWVIPLEEDGSLADSPRVRVIGRRERQ